MTIRELRLQEKTLRSEAKAEIVKLIQWHDYSLLLSYRRTLVTRFLIIKTQLIIEDLKSKLLSHVLSVCFFF